MSAATETPCPKDLTWSAFGAPYMDTFCVDGMLFDADSGHGGDVPCPFCQPVAFFDYQFGGNGVEPTCRECLTRLTAEAVTFHDGTALTWTVDCPTCGAEKPALMRDYDAEGVSR